jgi:light-regulated signal transduction histidine kinase (bacteriophytochrome)
MSAIDAESPSFVAPHTPIDITNCDREPIHIPGAIQPHGVLLGVRERDQCVVQASANASERLSMNRGVVGATLTDIIGEPASQVIRARLSRGDARTSTTIATRVGTFDATLHRSGGLAIVELEAAEDGDPLAPDTMRDVIRETLSHIERATSMAGLAHEIAAQMRRLTGFDRVWVYRFHEDWHGEIIGESMGEGIEPWLGLHYPASDIPVQARALFLKNWLRMIPDVAFTPVALEPVDNPETGEPLDLGDSVLRSVSPVHIEYLKSMGVTASLVISLIHRGALWGLIAGHHYSGVKRVPAATRTLCEFLAQALSLQVGLAEQLDDTARSLATREIESRLRQRLADDGDYQRVLTTGSPTLLDLTTATGAAVCDDASCVTIGAVPSAPDLRELVHWLHRQGDHVFHTAMLSKHYPPAANWAPIASGLLAIALSSKRGHYILWFRGEYKQIIRWAGDPNKPATTIPAGGEAPRLSPRGSFALWEEERRGTSQPWAPAAIEAATDLRRTLLDFLLARAEESAAMSAELEMANQRLAETTTELETQTAALLDQRGEREALAKRERLAQAEAERANQAKFDFLAMMSHELRTPLNAIGGYAQMLEIGLRGPVTEPQLLDLQRIQQSQRHLLGLINNVLNFTKLESGQVPFNPAAFDLRLILDELEALVLPQLQAKRLSLHVRRPSSRLEAYADAEKVRQILRNLLSNAIKFTGDGGSIVLAGRDTGDFVAVDVSDTGRGIPAERLTSIFEPFVQIDRLNARGPEGIGLGLAISRDLARNMRGDLVAASEFGKGSIFTLTIPARG